MAIFAASGRAAAHDVVPPWTRQPITLLARQVVQAGFFSPGMKLFGDLKVTGAQRVAALEPPIVIAANHSSHADVVAIREAVPKDWRRDLVAAAAADYFFESPGRTLFSTLAFNTLPIERHDSPRQSLRAAVRVLRRGAALVIFPEGGRAQGAPTLREFEPGVGFLARHADVPVLPVCIWGTHRMMPKGRRVFTPAPVRVAIGSPLRIEPGEKAQAFTLRLREAVRGAAAEIGAWPLVFSA